MTVDGFSDAIWHFIGYLRIADTTLRGDTLYDGNPPPLRPEDPYANLFARNLRPEFEDLESRRLIFNETTSPETLPKLSKLSPQTIEGPRLTPPRDLPRGPELHSPPEFDDGLRGGLSVPRLIAVEYESGGTETLLMAHQVNQMSDRDEVTADAVRDGNSAVLRLPELDVGQAIIHMMDEALAAGRSPLSVEAVQNTESLRGAIDSLDAHWAQTGRLAEHSFNATPPVGRIVDGQVSTDQLSPPVQGDILPWQQLITQDDALTSKVLSALGPSEPAGITTVAGLNSHVNDAAIVDVNEAAGSMIVGGNSYFSRGIVQVNVLTDSDHVDITTADPLQIMLSTGGNEVHNVAEFVTHDITANYKGAAGTPFWHVDVLPGNFYDIKTVVQFNGLDDNDRVVQSASGTYYEAATGLNGQANLARITNLDSYDVIIITGDYHRADWIFQYNIVYDCDAVKLLSLPGADATSDIRATTGFNQLTNTAAITTYDSAGYSPLNEAQRQLLTDMSDGVAILKPSAEWKLAGSGDGVLNVLFVKGDYYDVNTITQFNVMADADQTVQVSAIGGVMGAATGGNSAQNYAQIIDPGTLSTSKYLGGQSYDDAILIQANIVTDSDKIVVHDTTALVSELVAFMPDSDAPPASEPIAPRPVDVAQHDILI